MFDAGSFFIGLGLATLGFLCFFWMIRYYKAARYIEYLQNHIEKLHKFLAISKTMEHIEDVMKENNNRE